MLNTDLSILEIEALVGPMEPIPCEHSQHGVVITSHQGNATHYVQTFCTCGAESYTLALCQRYINLILNPSSLFVCGDCLGEFSGDESYKILGPVNAFIS